MASKQILEPIKLYEEQFKEQFKENCEKYFDDLVKKANVNVEENRATVKKYYAEEKNNEKILSNISKAHTIMTLLGVLIAIAVIAILVFAAKLVEVETYVEVIVIAVSVVIIILSIYGIVKKKKKINGLNDLETKSNEKLSGYKNDCLKLMSTLNGSFDWSIPSDLMEMTTPLIDLDHTFDVNKFQYLHEKYGLEDNNDPESSTNYVISGNIFGNPFLLLNTYNSKLRNKEYRGQITIHWTTVVSGPKGQTHTVSHSQVLVGTVTKPAPSYFYDTRLIFGNDAAPDLKFTRKPVLKDGADEKDIDKMVRKGEKALQKKTEKAVKKGESFNTMANSKFEVLFNALDRTNELQFRLLFTPLAQENMIKLITDDPYGDDFYFYKDKCLNYVFSKHSQTIDYRIAPDMFSDFDIDNARKKFLDTNTTFFKGLYFDLAPILSIPLYQQTKTHEYIYKIPYEAYNTKYEQESLANKFDKKMLIHPESKTDAILKCSFNNKSDDIDNITITAHTYKTIRHVDYVKKFGGDGRMHTIPVQWFEYVPLEKQTQMQMTKVDTTRQKFNNSNELINKLASSNNLVYERGLLSFLVNGKNDFKQIKKDISKKEEDK